jgi:hypothetical protein
MPATGAAIHGWKCSGDEPGHPTRSPLSGTAPVPRARSGAAHRARRAGSVDRSSSARGRLRISLGAPAPLRVRRSTGGHRPIPRRTSAGQPDPAGRCRADRAMIWQPLSAAPVSGDRRPG